MHNGFVTANDEKMSKSLKNFFTIREVTKLYHPLALSHFLLGTHYLSLYAPSLMIGAAVGAIFGGSAGELIRIFCRKQDFLNCVLRSCMIQEILFWSGPYFS